MSQGDGGKGSGPRPFSVPLDEFAANHERIFGKRPPRPRYVPPPLPNAASEKLQREFAAELRLSERIMGAPLRDQMEGARRALQDVTDHGIGSYRQHTDGTTEYIDRATLAAAKK